MHFWLMAKRELMAERNEETRSRTTPKDEV